MCTTVIEYFEYVDIVAQNCVIEIWIGQTPLEKGSRLAYPKSKHLLLGMPAHFAICSRVTSLCQQNLSGLSAPWWNIACLPDNQP